MSSVVRLTPSKSIRGSFAPPGDKSISHRALMFGALANGTSRFSNFLEGEDCLNTLKSLRQCGVVIRHDQGSGKVEVEGVGLKGLQQPSAPLYFGNSGTTMRLMLGLLSGQKLEAELGGDASLSKRPMKRVTTPLKQMGAQIKGADNANFCPLTIRGGRLRGIDFVNKIASAQVKSAILLAGLNAEGRTRVTEPLKSRDHTERFLMAQGANFKVSDKEVCIERTETLRPFDMVIPGDPSAAAFFIVGAAMTPGSEVQIQQVGLNPTRVGMLGVLKNMGAQIEVVQESESPEPIGTIRVQGGKLKGTRIVKEQIPDLIDELPILMTAMALAEGESLISGAEELRVKETDRIHSICSNLKAIGGDIDELPDGCLIRGVEEVLGGETQSFGDHRTAMSMAIATLRSKGEIVIHDTDCVATSFPDFFKAFEAMKK